MPALPSTDPDHHYYPDPLTAPPFRLSASAVIRFPSSGPYIHNNASHACVGVSQVWIDGSGQLVIDHASVGPVALPVAQPDETMAARGITVGPSGGGTQTRLRFGFPQGGQLRLDYPSHYAQLAGDTVNVWFGVLGLHVDTPTS